MRCDDRRRRWVEEIDRADLEAHAVECLGCARFLTRERALTEAVRDWRASTPPAPPALRARVLAAAQRAAATAEGADNVVPLGRPRGSLAAPRTLRVALAVAATLLVAVLAAIAVPRALAPDVVSVSGALLVDDALGRARAAEREHAEAIAALVVAAEPVLAAADDPATPPEQAARLRAYRDRLASIDDAIRQVQTFLETNPGHPSARTMLLAAYIDKTELLGELLAPTFTEEA